MSDRLKSMKRVVAVQAQTKRMAEWKLATIERRKAALEEAQRDLAGFLDGGELVGALASVALNQSRRLAQREAAAETDRLAQTDVTQRAQARHKLAETMTDAVAREEQAAAERQDLERMIEAFMARGPTEG